MILSLGPKATVTGVVTSERDFTAARAGFAAPKQDQAETLSCSRTCQSQSEKRPPTLQAWRDGGGSLGSAADSGAKDIPEPWLEVPTPRWDGVEHL